MADPLSLSASLAGLVSLSDTVFRYVYKYIRGVAGAKEEITKIAQELQSFTGILKSVQVLAQSLEEEGDTYDPAIRVHHVYHCEQTLSRIHDRMKRAAQKVEKGRPKDSFKQQLKWPFSKSETQEVLDELERHKSNLNLGITTDSMHKMQILLSRQNETDIIVGETRQVVRELRTEILVDGKKRRVLEFFMDTKTVNPQTSLDTNIKMRHPMTGLWLTESPVFIQWLDTPGSKIWLSGIPGGGKTVLAGAVIQEALTHASPTPTIGAAFFFCDYKNEQTLKATNIIGALASQLALQKDDAFNLLQDHYNELHPTDSLPKAADSDELRALVGKMCELFDQVLVVIDGIDECGDSMDEVAETLSDLANSSQKMSMAIFSRDDVAIARQIGDDFKLVSIAARTHDIELYVRAELESLITRGRLRTTSAKLKDDIREALVDKAEGMFRWVTCQLDYLCGFSSDYERRKALGELPPTLHETYLRLLQRLSTLPPSTKSKIQMCLHFIAFSPYRLSIIHLRCVISTPEFVGSRLDDDNMVSEEDIAFMCGSLLRKSDNGKFFEFAHFSVREFLEHESLAAMPDLEPYQVSQARSYQMLAMQSLRFLQLSNYEVEISNPTSLMNHHIHVWNARKNPYDSFHNMAARLSLKLSKSEHLNPTSGGLMKSLFHPRKSSSFLLFATSVCVKLILQCTRNGLMDARQRNQYDELAERLLRDEFQPIHFAAALNLPDICSHLIETGSNPKAACSFGSPFQLSIASILSLIFDGCDSTPIEQHCQHLYGPINATLATSHQRNSTLKVFERTSLEPMNLSSSDRHLNQSMVLHAIIIAFIQNDFWALQMVLASGMTLEDNKYNGLLRKLMNRSAVDMQRNEKPLLSFLQYISSALEAESGWQLDIGRLIWNTAVELGLSFTKDPSSTDLRISLSKQALLSRAFAAIKEHDSGGLQECLLDGRLDLSQRYPDPEERRTNDKHLELTLIHFAVLEDNAEAIRLLAQAGCDPNMSSIENDRHWRPIHDACSIEVVNTLLVYGAKATDVEAFTGFNIWHRYGSAPYDESEFYASIAKQHPSETAEALLMKSKDGQTPLSEVLTRSSSSTPSADLVEGVMALIAICQGIADFWSRHGPLFGAAAAFGSEKVIRRLIEVGARLDTVLPDIETPLHRIGIHCSEAALDCLKALFPEGLGMRIGGHIPLQRYLERCVHHKHPIDDTVAQGILSDADVESIDGRGTTMWEYYCLFSPPGEDTYGQSIDETGLNFLWDWLLKKHSAMQVYEKKTGRNGITTLLSRLVTLDVNQELVSRISPHALSQAIGASRYWETAKSEPNVLRFLQWAMKTGSYQIVDVLLEHDVSVVESVDDYSTVQIACQSPLAVSICSAAEGRDLLRKILDLANPKHLGDYNRKGLTILHSLATEDKEGAGQLHWLIKLLLDKGVDINQKKRFRNRHTPIAYHIIKSSLSCAEYLLEMGADPGMAEPFFTDAVMEASLRGYQSFLNKVLELSKSHGPLIDWARAINIIRRPKIGKKLYLANSNVVHLTSWGGHVECMQFYVNHGLVQNLEITSSTGWTAMHVAALAGKPQMIEYLNSEGCKVMPQTEDKATPLHIAVRNGRKEASKTLIQLGAGDVPDAIGMTPTMYASKANDIPMLRLLTEMLAQEKARLKESQIDLLPRKLPEIYAGVVEKAIRADDIDECKRLFKIGYPLDVNLRSPDGATPLALALHLGHLSIAEWLLEHGIINAKTRLCVNGRQGHQGLSMVDIAIKRPGLGRLLRKLVNVCLKDGSGWPLLNNHSFMTAIGQQNTQGFIQLLEVLEQMATEISALTNLQPAEVLHTLINKEYETGQEGWRETALSFAVKRNNIAAARLLLEKGAEIDTPDSIGRTALVVARSQEMMTLLISYGASLTSLFAEDLYSWLGWGPEVFAGRMSAYMEKTEHSTPYTVPFSLTEVSGSRAALAYKAPIVRPTHLLAILKADINLNEDPGSGISLMHLAIVNKASSTFVLNKDLDLENTLPFPWHLLFPSPLSFIDFMFGQFRRKVGKENLARIAHLQPKRGWSPLCWAASRHKISVVQNCLSLGADVDFEGSPHGSALVVACGCGLLDIVRILVREGASISYKGENGHRNVFDFCRSKIVRHWLLVGRFTEQRRIDVKPYWEHDKGLRPWSGTAAARLKLVGDRAMCFHETMIDYAGRLAKLRKEWRGTVIPTVCMDGIIYR